MNAALPSDLNWNPAYTNSSHIVLWFYTLKNGMIMFTTSQAVPCFCLLPRYFDMVV